MSEGMHLTKYVKEPYVANYKALWEHTSKIL